MTAPPLPNTHRALVFRSRDVAPQIETIQTPQPQTGSCVVRVYCAPILPYAREVYTGSRPYPLPMPLVGGVSCIARVAAVGQDATSLKPGQLVYVDCFIHGRDDPDVIFLLGAHQGDSAESAKLMTDTWRDGTYAEYARVPLEAVEALDESRLLSSPDQGGLGYTMDDLAWLFVPLVPFGGLDDIGIRPGERVIIAPATGWYGGAAVQVALAMGAIVIAAGRNGTALADIKTRMGAVYGANRVETVQLSGDSEKDTAAFRSLGLADAFFEISPPAAANATFISSAIKALKRNGRVSLMGGILTDVSMPFRYIMHRNIKIMGKWMYERDAIRRFIQLVESGLLKLGSAGGVEIVGSWQLDQWDKAFTAAAENSTLGKMAVMKNFVE